MYESILLPVAPTGVVTDAITHVKSLASQSDATVHLVSVVDIPDGARGASRVDALTNRVESGAERRVSAATTTLESAGVEVVSHVTHGDPREAIEAGIDETDADVVVMPTHARTGLERFLLGSVTEHVIRTSPVPVLTVPIRNPDA